jgi:hypothetical protein
LSIDERIFLYKESKIVDGGAVPLGVAHPVDISARDVEALLANLVYVRKTLFADPRELPIFTPAQANKYSVPLSKALATLSPTERLRFLAPESRFENILSGSTGTTGVIFASNDSSLDIAFDAIHDGINDGDGGRPEEVYFAEDPTSLTSTRAVVPFAGSRRYVDTKTRTDYPGWIVVDRAKLVALPIQSAKAAPETAVAKTATDDVEGQPVASHAKDTETKTPVPAPPPPTTADADAYTEIRRKIESLKRLHKDGVITDEEYKKQFDELLEKL